MTAATTQSRTVDVLDTTGAAVGTVTLDPVWFGVEPHVGVVHQVVTAQLAAARRGTAKTKTRGQARGGGRKPWRQKGTGRARQGSIRAPHWTGGGVAHGRSGKENFTKRVNKKLKRRALASVLSDRAETAAVRVVRDLGFEEPRTRAAVALLEALEALEADTARVLVVLDRRDEATEKSFRNLPRVHLLTVDQLNTYDAVVSDVIVFDEAALPFIGSGSRTDLAAREAAQGGADQ